MLKGMGFRYSTAYVRNSGVHRSVEPNNRKQSTVRTKYAAARFGAAAVLAGATLLLAGCGSDHGASPAPTTSGTAQAKGNGAMSAFRACAAEQGVTLPERQGGGHQRDHDGTPPTDRPAPPSGAPQPGGTPPSGATAPSGVPHFPGLTAEQEQALQPCMTLLPQPPK
jgi:hypothetical protein